MKAKKLLAGILAGTLVLGTFTVPVSAAYTSKQKPITSGSGVLTCCDGKAEIQSDWWDPQMFSHPLKLSGSPVTVTMNVKTFYNPDGAGIDEENPKGKFYCDASAFVHIYSSKDGCIYGPGKYDAAGIALPGNKNKMVEYASIQPGFLCAYARGWTDRNDGEWVWNEEKQESTYQTNSKIDYLEGWEMSSTACPWNDEFTVGDWCKQGNAGLPYKCTAWLEKEKAVIKIEFNGLTQTTKIPVYNLKNVQDKFQAKPTKADVEKNGVYICFGSGNAGGADDLEASAHSILSNMKYEYDASLDTSKMKIALKKTSMKYNGKAQKPDVVFTGVAATNFDVVYQSPKSTMPGKYNVSITGKGKYEVLSQILSYEITKADQTVKAAKNSYTKKFVNKKKKKVTKAKKFSFTITASAATKKAHLKVSTSKKSALTAAVGKKVKKKGKNYIFTITVTVKKNCKAGTYKVYYSANEQDLYNATAQKTVKIKIK